MRNRKILSCMFICTQYITMYYFYTKWKESEMLVSEILHDIKDFLKY